MAKEDALPDDYRRLLEAFGYHWNKHNRVWVNRKAGRALSAETIRVWSVDELRTWLTRGVVGA